VVQQNIQDAQDAAEIEAIVEEQAFAEINQEEDVEVLPDAEEDDDELELADELGD